jgi:hypothetical protein
LLGYSLGLIIYLGVPMVLVDRFLLIKFFRDRDRVLRPSGDTPGFDAFYSSPTVGR